MKNPIVMDGSNLTKNILRFTIPVSLMGMLQVLYNAADVAVVGKFAGSESLAAVGCTGSPITLILAIFIGISVGASVVVAQRLGGGDQKGVFDAVHTAISTSVILGFLVGIIGYFFSGTILGWMGTPSDVIEKAALYMRIYSIGLPFNLVYNFTCSIMNAAGDTKTPLFISIAAGVTNIALNLVLVINFGLDVAGVGIATVVSMIISMVLGLLRLTRGVGAVKLYISRLTIKWNELRQIITVGLPSGINSGLYSFSNVLIQSTVNTFVTAAVAGNAAAQNFENFQYHALHGFYSTAITFIGYNYGAGKYENFGKIMKKIFLCILGVGVITGVLMYFGGPYALTFYTDDPVVMDHAMNRIIIFAPTYFMCGIMDSTTGMLRAINKSSTSMMLGIIGVIGIRLLWIYVIFPLNPTLLMLYISYPVSWIVTITLNVIAFLSAKKKLLTADHI